MKSFTFKKIGLAVLATTFMFGAVSAQARYKNKPRVKIDAKKNEFVKNKETHATTTTTAAYNVTPVNTVVNNEVATAPVVTNEVTTASVNNNDVVVATTKTKSKTTSNEVKVKTNKKADIASFTNKLKETTKLMDIKDVKKSALETWILIMIILYAAGLLFIILGIVFTFTLFGPLGLIFYIIGALCMIGASIVLILGLVGVM